MAEKEFCSSPHISFLKKKTHQSKYLLVQCFQSNVLTRNTTNRLVFSKETLYYYLRMSKLLLLAVVEVLWLLLVTPWFTG